MGLWNVSIHDVVMDDVSGKTYLGGGHLFQESSSNHVSVLHDISITHVTAFNKDSGSAMLVVGNNKSFPEMYGFTWANNIFSGSGGIATTGGRRGKLCLSHEYSSGHAQELLQGL